MAIAFVAAATGTSDYGSSIVVTKPTGTVNGHVMVAVCGGTPSTPSGWTSLGTVASGTASLGNVTVFYKVAASEGANYTFTLGGSFLSCAVIATYSGVDTTTPVDTTNFNVTAGSGTNFATTAVTAAATQWGLTWAMGYEFGTATVRTWTESSGVERADFGVVDTGSPDNTNALLVDSNGLLTAGSFSRTQTRSIAAAGGAKGAVLLNTANTSVAVSGTETGTRTEAQSILAALPSSDTALSTEGAARIGTSSSETVSGAEGTAKISFTSSDAVSGNEGNSIAATRSDSDTGQGAEVGSVSQTTPDTGHGTDAQSLVVNLSSSDSAHGTDTETATSPFPFSADSLSVTESFSIVTTQSSSDSAHGTDNQSVSAPPIPRDPKDYPNTLLLGPGGIFLADYGAVEPTTTGTPDPLVWTDLGAVYDGVELTVDQEWEEITFKQLPGTVARRLTKRYLSVKTQLAEATLTNLMYALNDVPAAVTSGAGYTKYTPTTVDRATPLTYRAIIIRGWAPGLTGTLQKRRTLIIRKGLSTDGVEVNYKKDDQTTYTVTWDCHYAGAGLSPFVVIDEP